MKLPKQLLDRYGAERQSAGEAQRTANEIAFAPVVFQVSRLMKKFGILSALNEARDGLSIEEIAKKLSLSEYTVKLLLESSLSIGTVLLCGEKFRLSKAGYFLLTDEMVDVDIDFIHDVCYEGLFRLEETLKSGKPEGLKVFGQWATIYEALSHLPPHVRKSWLAFDHFYSDLAFEPALKIIFSRKTDKILDVGGNTGRFAKRCVGYDENVRVTIMDLAGQISMMKDAVAGAQGAGRIDGLVADLLDAATRFPRGFDAIWLSQFLDCFAEEQIVSILARAAESMSEQARLYILEPFWDRQRYETAAYSMTQISVYFAAMANGNSKIYHSDDMIKFAQRAGLKISQIHDGLGVGHTLLCCERAR